MDSPLVTPRRQLGNTALTLPILGFGASPLGSVFEQIDEAEGVATVHEAVRLGVNYFDCSPFYGATKAETVLGRALKDIPRDKFILSTKVGRYGESSFDFSAQRVTASVDESMQRLNVRYIDIILCHDVEFGDLDQVVSETLPALALLKAQGKVGYVGFSALPLRCFRYILDRAPPGSVDVVLSYCHYNLQDTSLLGLLPYLQEKGVGVINASAYSMGLLTKAGPPSWHPAGEEIKAACRAAGLASAAAGQPVEQVALAFALREAGISSTLVGMSTRAQLHQNIAWANESATGRDGPAERAALEALAGVRDATWPSGRD